MRLSINKNTWVVFIFFLFMSVMPLGMLLKLDHLPQNKENRKLAELPSIKIDMKVLRKYPGNYTKYFNDHVAFRNIFVKINFLIRYNLLSESPSSEVVLGKNNWLFFAKDGSIDDYRGITHFDDKTLQEIAISYENKRILLSRQGIKYILLLAPNKETIYDEFMPDSIFKIRNRSGMDEITEYLYKHTNVYVIDMRNILFDNKKREQLYLKTSSSWNDYAAFLAYREIMKPVSQWFPGAKANDLAEFSIKREKIRGDDLAEMMGGADFFSEQKTILVPNKSRKARRVDYNTTNTFKDPFAMKLEDTNLPRVIVFRDCFFDKIIPFLSEHFEYSRYYWQSWNPDTPITEIIKTVQPDIVIEEKVERFLKLKKNP